MRQTLFYIPHEIAGLPVFGFGWAFIVWAIVTVLLLVWLVRKQGWNEETLSYLPVLGVLGFAVAILLPGLEEYVGPRQSLGLPIRGYGVFLLLAVVAGIGLAVWRARLMGVDPEIILSLAFVMFIAGILGARGAFVYQYWNEQFSLPGDTLMDTLRRVVDVTKGGLIVFGSLVGGLAAALWFCWFRKQPFLAIADLIAPSLVLGLAIGRIGCLMNGCCYGGLCEQPWQIQFPAGETSPTPPYGHQLGLGQLHGFTLGEQPAEVKLLEVPPGSAAAKAGKKVGDVEIVKQVVVKSVVPESPADKAGLKVGDVIVAVNGLKTDLPRTRADGVIIGPLALAKLRLTELYRMWQEHQATGEGDAAELFLHIADGRRIDATLRDDKNRPTLPAVSLPVHPTQIYAAINAALLTLLLLAYYPFRRHDGELIALLLTLYPITRIAEEIIRDDEGNWFLGLTFSQNISALLLVGALALWIYILAFTPKGSAFPPERSIDEDRGEPGKGRPAYFGSLPGGK